MSSRRDRRGERRHAKKVKRARWWKYHKHQGGVDHHQVSCTGRQGAERRDLKGSFHKGSESMVTFDEERNRILQKKEAQRRRRAREG